MIHVSTTTTGIFNHWYLYLSKMIHADITVISMVMTVTTTMIMIIILLIIMKIITATSSIALLLVCFTKLIFRILQGNPNTNQKANYNGHRVKA